MTEMTKTQLRALRSQAAKGAKLDAEVLDELAKLTDEHHLYVFRPETRCRVCNSNANDSVNKMLAHAFTYTDIERTLAPINDLLPDDQKITYHSIYQHAKRHFPIEQTAQAVYRRIIEKRAEEHDVDYVAGVGGALTPLAYLDVTMQKGFQNLTDNATTVSVETGLRAAERLHELTKNAEDEQSDMGEMMLKVQKLVDAVKAIVPPEDWARIVDVVENGAELPRPPLDVEVVDDYDEILDDDDPDLALDVDREGDDGNY